VTEEGVRVVVEESERKVSSTEVVVERGSRPVAVMLTVGAAF